MMYRCMVAQHDELLHERIGRVKEFGLEKIWLGRDSS